MGYLAFDCTPEAKRAPPGGGQSPLPRITPVVVHACVCLHRMKLTPAWPQPAVSIFPIQTFSCCTPLRPASSCIAAFRITYCRLLCDCSKDPPF